MIMAVLRWLKRLSGRLHAVAAPASSAAGERMKSSSARATSACADAVQMPPENVVSISTPAAWPDHVDAVEVHQLAQLLEAKLNLATSDQRAHRNARRRLHDARADHLGNPQRSKSCCSATPLGPVE